MRFIFSAPFRTNININNLKALDAPETVVKVITSALKMSGVLANGYSWQIPWRKVKQGELHYAELSQDQLSFSAIPLLRLMISGSVLSSSMSDLHSTRVIKDVLVNHCVAEYYGNTIAILRIDITLTKMASEAEVFAVLDRWSTAYCSDVIKLIKPMEENVHHELIKHHNLFFKLGDFNVFFRRNALENNVTEPKEDMLWVTRLFMQSAPVLADLLEGWTQQADLSARTTKIGQANIAFCVGNSIVFDVLTPEEESALYTALSICSYFYVLHDVLNQNLRQLFLHLSKNNTVSSTMIHKANSVRSYIEFMENEINDTLIGMQGYRDEISRLLLKTWNYGELIGAVKGKKYAVKKIIEFSIQEKQGRYGRIIEAILAGIGGVALMDFAINIYTFDKSTDSFNIDLPVVHTLYLIIFLLFVFIILVLKKK